MLGCFKLQIKEYSTTTIETVKFDWQKKEKVPE